MLKKFCGYCIKIFGLTASFSLSVGVQAIPIGGVEFPDGLESFADEVVYYAPGSDVGGAHRNPNNALGAPGGGSTSLGNYGTLIVKFTDNALTTSGDTGKDLWIFEVGSAVEWFNVSISADNLNWINLGNIRGQPTGIDIDAYGAVTQGARYSYVRLRDVSPNQSNYPYGEADIDAIGAISSVSVFEPGSLVLFGLGALGLGINQRRKKTN